MIFVLQHNIDPYHLHLQILFLLVYILCSIF